MLNHWRQASGIDDWPEVTRDEIIPVGDAARKLQKVIFQRGEWAYPTHDFDERTPGCCREMEPGESRTPQRQQPSAENKDDKRQVHRKHCVRKKLIQVLPPRYSHQHTGRMRVVIAQG